jgi:hypothetical protein
MAIYRVGMIVRNPTRNVVTQIAGCDNEEDAERKARRLFEVEKIKKIELSPLDPKWKRP